MDGLLDANPYLLAFTNGVYDITTGTFRGAEPGDAVRLSCGYAFVPEYMEYVEHPERDPQGHMAKMYRFLRQIFPDPDLYEFVLTFLSSVLFGRNMEQTFVIFTGTGANGKSALMNLVKCALGEYYLAEEATLLTSKRSVARAYPNPATLNLRGRRLVTVADPVPGERINAESLKLLTTGTQNVLAGRLLHSTDVVHFPATFKLVMVCNNLPLVDAVDGDTWRRIQVVPCESTFVDASVAAPGHIVQDPKMEAAFSAWRERFMCLLITRYHHVNGRACLPPAKVLKKTAEYFARCDAAHSPQAERKTVVQQRQLARL